MTTSASQPLTATVSTLSTVSNLGSTTSGSVPDYVGAGSGGTLAGSTQGATFLGGFGGGGAGGVTTGGALALLQALSDFLTTGSLSSLFNFLSIFTGGSLFKPQDFVGTSKVTTTATTPLQAVKDDQAHAGGAGAYSDPTHGRVPAHGYSPSHGEHGPHLGGKQLL